MNQENSEQHMSDLENSQGWSGVLVKLITRVVPERRLWVFTGSVALRLMLALTAGSGVLLESGLPPVLVRAFCLPLWSAHGFCYRIACFSIEQRKLLLSR